MYEIKIYTTGKFEVYNKRREKMVFAAIDPGLRSKGGETLQFKNVKEMMGAMTSQVSLATFKKMSKALCAW